MNPILLDLGFIEIRWYSVFILIAFTVGYLLVSNRCKKEGISSAFVTDLCFYLVIFCILGARIYFCLFELRDYKNIIDIFKIWEGGLAIHGGIIAGIFTIYFYARKKEIPILKLLDIFAPALVLGQAIGRWGNFFNQEAFGKFIDCCNPGILLKLPIPEFIIDGMYIDAKYINGVFFESGYYHPTFLYESFGCILIFIFIMFLRNKKNIKVGQIAAIYFIGYGILRFLIEALREDSLMFFNLKAAQLISILMIIIGLYLFIKPYIKKFKN